MLNKQIKKGIGFGLTSGVVTTLGLIIGLYASTQSKLVVISGIASISIVDSFSDALGIHISEESENKHTNKEIWLATLSTLFFKMIFAATFIVPFLFLTIKPAIIVSIIYGALLLITFSFIIARSGKTSAWKIIFEHMFVFILVLFLTYFLSTFIKKQFLLT